MSAQPLSLPEMSTLIMPAEALALETLPPMALTEWAKMAGRDPSTVKGWAENGWIKTENIHGQIFIMAAETVLFNRRVKRGCFGQRIKPVTIGKGRKK